ncbi:branched-chain amino acid ABC transporter permease [Roseicyclus sp. F158]|uniref:Branched-chain amino acid ABC transporter permease n=1 Tax=Tropicimonas omnivorans TaxID=3075590 RepID=A0ABU3DEQ7_9RHOB|nr:branched-chain amino acid ABC transporter permease [Roseicyclus sp. F158]MDT0682207.1 branched-chain amino acid ABC transporter permease [Roseicyclus sp. F158]
MSKWIQLAILAALIVILPFFFPSGYYYRIGALVFVNGIAVLGLVILIGFAGQISLGHAGFAGIGAYACALAPEQFGLHPAFALLLGAALSAGIAALIGRPILRLKGYYLAVATLGFGILVAMTIQNERALTGGPDGMAVEELGLRDLLRDLGWRVSGGEFWYGVCGIALLIGAWIALNLRDSPTGRAMRALHGSEIASRTLGIDVARQKLVAFVISAVFASVSGSLLALQNRYITPDVAGFMHSIELVTMAVLGGAGSVMGGIFGAAILTLLPQVLTVLADYEQVVLGAIMVTVMIFMPQGLLPSIARRLRRTRK